MKRILYLASGVSLLLAAVFQFIFIGYGTTALVLTGASVCFAFFAVLHGRTTKTAVGLRRTAFIGLALGFLCFLAAEIPVLADAHSDENTDADYIIVMGAGVNGTVPSLSMRNRLDAACEWLTEHPDSVAVLSGAQGGGEDISEAQAMYDWLCQNGIEPSRLLLEEQATNSYENILCSLAVIEQDGGNPSGTVAIVSNDYHLHRIRYIAVRLGCEPVCVSARTTYPSLFINYAVREAAAMWKCRLFGIE